MMYNVHPTRWDSMYFSEKDEKEVGSDNTKKKQQLT